MNPVKTVLIEKLKAKEQELESSVENRDQLEDEIDRLKTAIDLAASGSTEASVTIANNKLVFEKPTKH